MRGESTEELSWHVARRCDSGACVEIGVRGEAILVRSSVDPRSRCVELSRDEWQVFIAGVKEGDFDDL